jgi:hypothetical protein
MNWMSLLLALCLAPVAFGAEAPFDPVAVSEETVTRSLESPLRFGLDLKYRPISFPRLTPSTSHGAQIAFEWLPIGFYKRYAGKPAIGISAGWGRIGHLDPSKGKVGLSTWPLAAHIAYRADFFDNQILVPFVKIARSIVLEKRRPGGSSRYDSWDYSLGAELCLNAIDGRSARQLDFSSGINNTYLVVEYLKSVPLRRATQDNLSREEWQVGLRFEM